MSGMWSTKVLGDKRVYMCVRDLIQVAAKQTTTTTKQIKCAKKVPDKKRLTVLWKTRLLLVLIE